VTTLQGLISKVGIDLSDVTPGIAAANAQIGQGITQATTQAQGGLNQLRGSFDVLSQAESQAEQQAIRTAQAQARAMVAEGDRAGAVRVLAQAQSEARGISEQTNFQIQAQIANLENGSSMAEQYGAALQSSMTSVLGPVAVVTAAIGVATGVVTSFADAFKFDAQLEATTKSINVQLNGVRDSATVWAQAKAYGDEYKVTQEDINGAMVSAMPIIRQSHASMEEILGDFDRLKIRSPEKSFQDAARALGELQAGQAVSIEKLFNVPANDANRMKKEIEGGADAVQVLSDYLDTSGIGMDALKANTEGAMGALKDYAKAMEGLTIAEGNFAKGPGIGLLSGVSVVIGDLTKMLGDGQGGLGGIFKNTTALTEANTAALLAFQATLYTTGDMERALAAAASVRAQVYTDQVAPAQQVETDIEDIRARRIQASVQAETDRVDVTRLSEAEQTKLAKALEDTGNRAEAAYTKVAQAQTDEQEKGQAAAQAHAEKLASLAEQNADRLRAIDATASAARAKATDDLHDRVRAATEDGNRRLVALETAYEDDLTSKRAAAAARAASIDADLAQKILDDRASSARKLADIETQIGAAALVSAQASADRQIALGAQLAQAQTDAATKLATFEQATLDARAAAQIAYQQRVSAAQASADRSAEDAARTASRQQEDAATRASDQAADRQTADADRAQAHVDRLLAIQAKASGGGGVGQITTLSGGRFTTAAMDGSGAGGTSVSDQVAAENARYQAQVDAQARSEALTDSRAARDAATQRTRAAEDRAIKEQDLAAAAAQIDRDYAAQLQKAQDAADKQRGVLAQAAADKLAAIQAAARAADAAAATSDAATNARIAEQIAKEREAQALREADATAAATRAHAELITQTNAELATRQNSYDVARRAAQAATALQIQDENTAYAKRLVETERQRQAAIAAQATADAQAAGQEAKAYKQQEDARATAYAKQKTQLETALGEQLAAYTKAQEDIGNITHTEADRREKLIADSYGRQAAAQRQAFNQAFGALISGAQPGGDRSYDAIEDARALRTAGGTAISIGNISLPNVTDPKSFLSELRRLVINDVRATGGDANAYWGGG